MQDDNQRRHLSIGHTIHRYTVCDSTNTIAMQLVREGAPHGTVVLAQAQTKGRGRGEHTWVTQSGSLAISIILQPNLTVTCAGRLTMLAAYTVVKTCEAFTSQHIGIKWPNDIFIDGKKICGILIETTLCEHLIDSAVMGIGINLKRPLEPVAAYAALPQMGFLGDDNTHIDENHFVEQLLSTLQEHLSLLAADSTDTLLEFMQQHSITLGQHVTTLQGSQSLSGIAVGLSSDGALLISDATEKTHRVVAGEVIF